MKYDFEGWATKNGMKCSDGVTIEKDAFKSCDGRRVPLFWNHRHEDVDSVLGFADLENRDMGVYCRASFNNTEKGQHAKEAVIHGDVTNLSICANNLDRVNDLILHGVIREVSLVPAGANPGAFIESTISHGMPLGDEEDEGIIYTNEKIALCHAEEKKESKPDSKEEKKEEAEEKKESKPDSKEEKKEEAEEKKESKTVQEIINAMDDDQKAAVAILVEQAAKEIKKEDEEMHHNIFDKDSQDMITHSDMKTVISDIKRLGSLKESIKYHMENGVLRHAIPTEGMVVSEGTQQYGFRDPSMLFPDYKTLNNPPEFISRNMDWVSKFMTKVHRTPFSRVKSVYADITESEARARGYIKGKLKKEEVFTLLKRTTSAATIYKKQKLDRDDILEIVDFNVLAWIQSEMRMMLNEEIARAALIGDGRPSDSDDKIHELNIRPIAKDAALFNIIVKVDVPTGSDQATIANATIKAIIRARKNYKGSGRPDFWTTEDVLTEMLLLDDKIGHPIYKTEMELATKLRVQEIIPVEPMEGYQVSVTEDSGTKTYPLLGVVVNVGDYNIGTDKGGEISFFEDFDIDYNQQKYLMEARMSGALIKPFSAMTIVLNEI